MPLHTHRHLGVQRSALSVKRFILFVIFHLAFAICARAQGTPLSGIAIGTPARDSKFVGHTAAGVPKQFVLSSFLDVYNVKLYGATGNGSTDDTAAIAATFAAAPAGATILFPPGTYKMTSYVTIAADHQTIFGYGAKITSNATGQDRKFLVSGRTGIKFLGLRFDGGELTTIANATAWFTYTPATNPGAIHFLTSSKCSVDSCDFTGVNFPVTILGACSDISILNSTFARYYAAVYSYPSGTGDAEVSSVRTTVRDCTFNDGLHRVFPVAAQGSARDYTIDNALDSGAIKLFGLYNQTTANGRKFSRHGYVVTGNIITGPGEMGIEIHGVNDAVVSKNVIQSPTFGISLAGSKRCVVSDNVVNDFMYAGIELDGNPNTDEATPLSFDMEITNNVLDGRDQYGRPMHWVIVGGIVIGGVVQNVNISGGSINYALTGIKIVDTCSRINISGVSIQTNDQSGYGGTGDYTGGPWNQGIYIANSHDITIRNLCLSPSASAWQKMINLVDSDRIEISNSLITANNTCIYAASCDDLTIRDNTLSMGSALGGFGPAFLTIDSATANVLRPKILNNRFSGTAYYGINLYNPSASYSITGAELIGNSTERCGDVTGDSTRFVYRNTYPAGTIGSMLIRGNRGPAASTLLNSILREYAPVTGTVTDEYTTDIYFTSYGTTINLQSAAGYTDQLKTIYYFEGTGNLVVHPQSGQTINGSSSDITLTTVGSKLVLRSTGSDWIIVSQ